MVTINCLIFLSPSSSISLITPFLTLIAPDLIRRNKALLFLIDGRPKQVMYCNVSFKLVHIDIEVIEPEIRKDHAAFQSMNIFFFPTDFTFIHTISWRYIKFIET